MRETGYQAKLVKKLYKMFPGCVVVRNDPEYIQGIPDITIFHEDTWGMLEIKISENAPVRPNQGYHVQKMNAMSYAAFIYPENEEVILSELQQTFRSRREARAS